MKRGPKERGREDVEVLVSGADGFIGRTVVRHLEDAGHRVTGLVYQRRANPGEVEVDLTIPSSLAPLVRRRFDAVVHAAGVVDQRAPARMHRVVNAEGTRAMVTVSERCGVGHFVHLSSIAVYGLAVMGEHRRESSTRRSWGLFGLPYMRSKAVAERHVEQGEVPFTILRLPAVFGDGDSVVTRAMVPPLLSGRFDMADGTDRLFTTLWVENLGRVVTRVLEVGPRGCAYNTGDAQTTWRAFVSEYARALDVDVRARPRTLLSLVRRLDDTDFLFRFTNSYFGAHFPCEALHEALGPEVAPWQPGVRAAVDGYLRERRTLALPPARG